MPGHIIVLEKDVSQQQGRVTDNLASIIQRVQFEHRTGELHVKRYDGLAIEQGSIIFVNGRAVQAQLGSYQGAVAFDMLRSWKQCVFIFAIHSGSSLPVPFQTPAPQNGPGSNSGSFDGFAPSQTQSLNDRPQSYTQPLDGSSASNIHTPLPQNSPTSKPGRTNSLDGFPSAQNTSPLSQNNLSLPSGWTQPLEGVAPSSRTIPLPPESDKQRLIHPSNSSIPLVAVPRATMSVVKAIGLINKTGLPRTCRQVILLIDGRLSVNEIIAAASTSSEETIKALSALESIAVITISKPG
jgi:hypothetical protein